MNEIALPNLARSTALKNYRVLDSAPEPQFDEVVAFAARALNAGMATISLVDEDRVFFKARVGISACEGSRTGAPGVQAMAADDLLVIPDAQLDPQFKDSPLVVGEPHLRFYAGAPLVTPDGTRIGALCVFDTQARPDGVTREQGDLLKALARQVVLMLELRSRDMEAERRQSNLFTLVSKAPIGVVQKELDGRINFINAEYAELLGRSRAELIGHSVREFLHPDDRQKHIDAVNAAIAGDVNVQLEERYLGPDGRVIWASNSISISRDADGAPLNLIAVARDITERIRATEELAASERKFRVIADAMPQMVWSAQPDGYHDYYNSRWQDFLDMPKEAAFGEGWSAALHPDDAPRAFSRWSQSLKTGEPYEFEYRLRHRSGEYRWVLARALAIRDATGRIERWFGTCTDIEDLKRSEEARDLLANELSHRIKNIFAVVGGLVSLTARGDKTAGPFAQSLRERLNALSLAHEYVRPHTGDGGARVDDEQSVQGLLRTLLRPYVEQDSPRFVFSGENVAIGAKTATALALVLHEQATNAVKYGALSGDVGRIAVSGARAGGDFVLVWREEGGPALSGPPTRRGFGTDMAARSAAGQLGGKIEHVWEPAGLVVRLVVPLDNLSR